MYKKASHGGSGKQQDDIFHDAGQQLPPIQKKSEGNSGFASGLPSQMMSQYEGMSGIALDDVSVHYNSGRPAAMGALAYAQGSEIHLGPGQEKHLSHELSHVIQQRQGRVNSYTQVGGVNINSDPRLESEADNFAALESNTRALRTSFTHLEGDLGEPSSEGVQRKLDPDSAVMVQLCGKGKTGITTSPVFATQTLFDSHYKKHVAEFGSVTQDQYLSGAQSLVGSSPGSGVLSKQRADGDTVFYNPTTNEFAILSGSKEIRTYFKPSGGLNYYNKQ
ncbi:uncharacterized protein DUF4157 [Anaerobacterium chartisolvens]|uniref:Uncharacterized protein DUF4157 n=1 Tax=Anaerobacterium chartisolvens TaxID=1297424 RepID=A0A369AV86_9FIRM|nr:DUF4157 domain-containing protein [Anaerobacterium chartisolvens]RCX11374.1 uncharacterized protein DUF4157 [Anaerobacterium chartisolvens]